MIRWITTTLGTAPHRAVQAEQGIQRLDVRELLDREGNPAVLVREVVEEGVRHLREGSKVVVCCEHGMSRSNAIAAGILATHERVPLEAAIRNVLEATGEDSIRLEVLSALRAALEMPVKHAAGGGGPRVFVTGASGMIGTWLGGEPWYEKSGAFLRAPGEPMDLRRDAVPLDLAVREQGINTIIHLAHPRIYATNRALGEALSMLKNVLDVCRENAAKLIYLSSCEIYSGHTGTVVANERLVARPATLLGLTKHLCEQLIGAYRQEHNLKAVVLRLTTVYGGTTPRPAFLWNFIEKALRNEEIRTHLYPAGYPTVDLIHVDDVCRAIRAAVEVISEGDFNLGSGQSVGTDEIARQVVELTASASRISHIAVQRQLCNLTADARSATETFGWKPAMPLRERIAHLVAAKLAKTI